MFNFASQKFEIPTATKIVELNRQYYESVIGAIPHKESKDAAKKVSNALFTSMTLVADQVDRVIGTMTTMAGYPYAAKNI